MHPIRTAIGLRIAYNRQGDPDMSIFLDEKASKRRQREARRAWSNRQEIVKALSHGKVTRRELVKWGLFTAGGVLAYKQGLNPFARSAYAQIPTGLPASPLWGVTPFSQPMPRFDVLARRNIGDVVWTADCSGGRTGPAPMKASNQTMQAVPAVLGGGMGPIEGRPPGDLWAHQAWEKFSPKIFVEAWQRGAQPNTGYNPQVPSALNSHIDPTATLYPCFHPQLPQQSPTAMWTFNGTIPPKLVQGMYGEPILFRHHNDLPADVSQNSGFGRNTISTHEHNGHHGAENDGFTGAFFFPGQYYDYHWPITLAGWTTINAGATDPKAAGVDANGNKYMVAGDWHETMSTHWFHDHMFSFTSQNVYKGNAAMYNLYSALDRGNEAVNDGINLQLPSGSAKPWGNLDYDVNLMLADKAWDANGQLAFDIFDFDGFIGDRMTVNLAYKPYFEVYRRKYRFRILNASVSRFFKVCLSDGKPFFQIANDGNLFPFPIQLTSLDEQGIAERYDIVIDFSRYTTGTKVSLVNLCEHQSGAKPAQDLTLAQALSGTSADPCVGPFLEFRVIGDPPEPDRSVVNIFKQMIPNPDISKLLANARTRNFVFGRGAENTSSNGATSFSGPWGIGVDAGAKLSADFGRVSAAPVYGSCEIWNLVNDGGGWDHPIHIHFEEGQVLKRNGSAANVPAWEKGRKDVYRLRPSGSIQIAMQFRDWGGMFMEHCHNTVHEDNAMLLRWEVQPGGGAALVPLPTPICTPQGVTFASPDDVLPTAF
jgi:FtsP/CotA-like multicopper oxidase with cupredoxin domain